MTVIMINKPDPIKPFLCLISKLWVNKCGPSELFPDISIPNTKSPLCKKSDKSFIKKVRRIANFHVGSRGRLCENMSIQFNIQRVTTIAFKRSETLQSCLKIFMLSPEVVFVKTCIFFVFFCLKIQLLQLELEYSIPPPPSTPS